MSPLVGKGDTPFVLNWPGVVLLGAVIVSLALHGLLTWQTRQMPIGHIKLDELGKTRAPVQVASASPELLAELRRDLTAPTRDDDAMEDASLDELAPQLAAEIDPTLPDFLDDPEPIVAEYDPEVADVQEAPEIAELPDPADQMSGLDALLDEPVFDDTMLELAVTDDLAASGLTDAAQGELTEDAANADVTAAAGSQSGGGADSLMRNNAASAGRPPNGLDLPDAAASDLLAQDTLSDLNFGGGVDPLSPELAGALNPAVDPMADMEQLTTSDALIIPIHLDHAFDYEVTRYPDAADGLAGQGGTFRVRISPKPRELQVLDTMPKDVIYFIDVSNSIRNSTVSEVLAGVGQALNELNPGDRFNLIVFNDNVRQFRNGDPVDASQSNVQDARRFLNGIDPDGSNTDVHAAIAQQLNRRPAPGRVVTYIVITDGHPNSGLTRAQQIINQITQQNDRRASIYCVGVPHMRMDANKYLLDFLAYRNGGRAVIADSNRDVLPTITALARELRYPLIRDVTLTVLGSGVQDVHPIQIADIHQGQGFDVFGRYASPGNFSIRIAGNGRQGERVQPVDFTFTKDLSTARTTSRWVSDQWAFWKLHHLYSERIRRGDDPQLINEIRELERR